MPGRVKTQSEPSSLKMRPRRGAGSQLERRDDGLTDHCAAPQRTVPTTAEPRYVRSCMDGMRVVWALVFVAGCAPVGGSVTGSPFVCAPTIVRMTPPAAA